MHYHYLKRVLCAITISATACLGMQALTDVADFSTSSLLQSGKWVKVKVNKSGMQGISYDKLKEWGFTNPSKVQVYGYSAVEHDARLLSTAPDDLPQIPSLHAADKLIFYGEGPERVYMSRFYDSDQYYAPELGDSLADDPQIGTPLVPDADLSAPADTVFTIGTTVYKNNYGNSTYYFLSDSQPETFKFRDFPAGNGTGEVYTTHYNVERRLCEEYTTQRGGSFFFSRPMTAGETRNFTFQMPGYVSDACIDYQFAGMAEKQQVAGDLILPSTVQAVESNLNRDAVMSPAGEYYTFMLSGKGRKYFTPKPAQTTHSFSLSAGSGDYSMMCAYQATLQYQRNNELGDSAEMTMWYPNLSKNAKLEFSSAPADMQLWDVTYPVTPGKYELDNIGGGKMSANLSNEPHPLLVAFSPSATLPEPEYAGKVKNQSLHSFATPDMVIVTTPLYHQEAERLADIHRNSYQKMDVRVLDQQEIFDEFSSGQRSPEAVRKFFQMLYLRQPDKFKYALMFGGGTYDNRGCITQPDYEFVVTYQMDSLSFARNATLSYCSDQYFGFVHPKHETATMIGETFGKLPLDAVGIQTFGSIAVGRIPALNLKEARDYVDKVKEYVSNPHVAGEFTTTLCFGDYGDKNKHVTEGVEKDAAFISGVFPEATNIKVYQEFEKEYLNTLEKGITKTFDDALSQPVSFITVSGHAQPTALGKKIYLRRDQEKSLTYGSMPFCFVGACSPYGLDNPDGSILSQMLLHEKQGIIGLVGPARTAFMTPNQGYEHAFCQSLFSSEPGKDCLGDVYLRAFNDMMSRSVTYRVNTMLYSLAGDPAIPVYFPQYKVKLNSTSDLTAQTDGHFMLQPAGANRLTGEIVDSNDRKVSFDGTVTLSLYAPPYSKKMNQVYQDDKTDTPIYINVDQNKVATASATVKDGAWTMDMVLPEIMAPDSVKALYRVSMSALSKPAEGYFNERVKVASGYARAMLDFANAGTRKSSDVTAPAVDDLRAELTDYGATLYASVSDTESGVAMSGLGRPAIYLDNVQLADAAPRFIANDNGGYTLRYPVPTLADGSHKLELRASDNAGNMARAEAWFTTVSQLAQLILTTDNKVTEDNVTIDLKTQADALPTQSTLIITDAWGNTVASKANPSFPMTLDLKDYDNGEYAAQVLTRTDIGYSHSQPVKFTVLKLNLPD